MGTGGGLSPAPEITVLTVSDMPGCEAWPGEVSTRGCLGWQQARHWGWGAAEWAPGQLHHQCWETGALPWSSSRGRRASALMLAKLT